ncbi:aldo/keto reductase [Oceaniradius stylonematis]|uniref:aldo/keto reductase n=1 Tax=Oceaniradius stylonematis TaxID=2184161 RepID=UPI003C79DC34
MPLAGIPLAVLAGRRLANTGIDTVLATSDRHTDDAVAHAAAAAGLSVFRGSTDDVLDRVLRACEDLPANAIVVRATGDNPIPDGTLACELAEFLESSNAQIAGIRWPESGQPYGVSLEAFRLGELRAKVDRKLTDHDREHVTPALWRSGRTSVFQPDGTGDASHLRGTIDQFDDYLRIEPIFREETAPVSIGWQELVARLARLEGQPDFLIESRNTHLGRQSELVLGTAQIGLDYGRGQVRTRPDRSDAVRVIRSAIEHGITHIDTARAYGVSETIVGEAIAGGWEQRVSVVTKLAPDLATKNAAEREVELAAENSVYRSLKELRLSRLDTLLLHRPEHRKAWNGACWKRVLKLKQEGLIRALGVSVSTPAEMATAAQDEDVELIQFPCNILDNRWDKTVAHIRHNRRESVVLHARSVLLQGLLGHRDLALWPDVQVDPANIVDWLESVASELGQSSVKELAIAFMRAKRHVDALVLGIPSLDLLSDTLDLFRNQPLSLKQLDCVMSQTPDLPNDLLDPSRWPALPK